VHLLHTRHARAESPDDCAIRPSGDDHGAQPGQTSSSSSSATSPGTGQEGGKGAVLVGAVLVVGFIVAAPLTIAHLAIESDPPACGWSFQSAPYADGAPGYLVPVGTDDPEFSVPPDRRREVAGQLSLEGLVPALATGDTQGGALRMRLQSVYRLELDAGESFLAGAGHPSPWELGSEHLSARFAEAEHIQLRLGVGLRHGSDADGTTLGVDGLFGADIYWGHPVTTSLEITGGTYGSMFAVQPRGTIGIVSGSWGVYAGYQGLWIVGDRKAQSFAMTGPVLGLRRYF
jgi:hypothetical protein